MQVAPTPTRQNKAPTNKDALQRDVSTFRVADVKTLLDTMPTDRGIRDHAADINAAFDAAPDDPDASVRSRVGV